MAAAAADDVEFDKRALFDALRGAGNDTQAQTAVSCHGTLNASKLPLSLFVDGAGVLPLPLSTSDAEKLKKVAKIAPFGHGLDTVTDTNVRKCLEVDPDSVAAPYNPEFWSQTVQDLGREACRGLGLNPDDILLQVKLYKLLLYEPGGHFLKHKDTEKEPGMFATMILQLPTQDGYTGGVLHVEHSGNSATYDFHSTSTSSARYAAFYTDAEHSVSAVTAGHRLCLSFNLVRTLPSGAPAPHLDIPNVAQLRVNAAIKPWLLDRRHFRGPAKLVLPLEHEYTDRNMSFAGLKGNDLVAYNLLRAVKKLPDPVGTYQDDLDDSDLALELYLVNLTKHEMGSASFDYDSWERKQRRGRGWYSNYYDDEDDEEDESSNGSDASMEEVHEVTVEIDENWVSEQGAQEGAPPPSTHFDEDNEVLGDEEIFGDEPDRREYEVGCWHMLARDLGLNCLSNGVVFLLQGYMGNSGPTLDYWYKAAALLIVPRRNPIEAALKGSAEEAMKLVQEQVNKEAENPDLPRKSTRMLRMVLRYLATQGSAPRARDYSYLLYGGARPLAQPTISNTGTTLLRIATNTGDVEDFVSAMRVMATKSAWLGSQDLIGLVTTAITKYGYTACEPGIRSIMIPANLESHTHVLCRIAFALRNRHDCRVGAIDLAKLIILNFPVDRTKGPLQQDYINSLAMIFRLTFIFGEPVRTVAAQLVVRCGVLENASRISLINTIMRASPSSVKDDEGNRTIVTSLFDSIISSNQIAVETWPTLTVAVLKLETQAFVDRLVEKLIAGTKEEQIKKLKVVLGSDVLWMEEANSEMGKATLLKLVDLQVKNLSGVPQPVFDWRQPNAKPTNIPAVDNFLRGPDQTFNYAPGNFRTINDARSLAGMISRMNPHVSTTATGVGRRAYITIIKRSSGFTAVQEWNANQAHLNMILEMAQKIGYKEPARAT